MRRQTKFDLCSGSIRVIAPMLISALLIGLVGLSGCGGGGGGDGAIPDTVTISVSNDAGQPVVGATVYLIPNTDINSTPFDASQVLDGTAENRDEPLEDAIAAFGGAMPQAVTDASGNATLTGVPLGKYFWFVSPNDGEHLPGGEGCRDARDATVILGNNFNVRLSSQPTQAANYVGSSLCLSCHSEYMTQTQHAHRLGFTSTVSAGGLQDFSRYPDFFDGHDAFLPATSFSGGTQVWFSEFTPSRGFDKFIATTVDPTIADPTVTNYITAYLWRDTTDGNKFKITLENLINPGQGDGRTMEVPLTYGGAVFKQRNLVRVAGRSGLYPLLQIQTQGDDSRFDRTRKSYRDYHLDWYWDNTNQLLQDPPVNKNFEAACAACHFTGYQRSLDTTTGEWLADGVNDPGGAFDIDGDGFMDEINTGCETCHGPGSDHVLWAGDPQNAGFEGRYIVNPAHLSPSREMQICGRCHDRVAGNGSIKNDEPLNSMNEMPPVGISRADYLANYTSRKGPKTSSYWADGLHSKSHHQQYTDLLKSEMHRNGRIITTCADCHNSHGDAAGSFRHHLRSDPDDPNGPLCANCHAENVLVHIQSQTGSTHAGFGTSCMKCHMTKAAKSGAGSVGLLLGLPTGTSTDTGIVYYQNDISSHLFGPIPGKTHVSVASQQPSSAMPIPYTNSCGAACHVATNIPFLTPLPSLYDPNSEVYGPVLPQPEKSDCPAKEEEER